MIIIWFYPLIYKFKGQGSLFTKTKYSLFQPPEKLKPLEKLKVINLSHSQQLIQIPDFSNTPNLESLILEGGTICLRFIHL